MSRNLIRVPGLKFSRGKFVLTPPKPKITEADVTKSICDYLSLKGWLPFRLQSGTFRGSNNTWITIGEPGIPDWVCLHPIRRPVFVEMKRPGAKRSPKQIVWHQRAALLGFEVITPDSLESFLEWYRLRYPIDVR